MRKETLSNVNTVPPSTQQSPSREAVDELVKKNRRLLWNLQVELPYSQQSANESYSLPTKLTLFVLNKDVAASPET
jgi:hypothetical protein